MLFILALIQETYLIRTMPTDDHRTLCAKPYSGFALVIALTLMAFLLLLIISMTLLVQVETTVSQTGKAQLQARESARLALMIAIGELQKHAGPDQRVTARAEILGDGNFDPAARFWTGIWDTTDPTAEPKWLVSGESLDPAALPQSSRRQKSGRSSSRRENHLQAPNVRHWSRTGSRRCPGWKRR